MIGFVMYEYCTWCVDNMDVCGGLGDVYLFKFGSWRGHACVLCIINKGVLLPWRYNGLRRRVLGGGT